MNSKDLLPCPFCGKKPILVIEDNEGNVHDEKYEANPWSGLWYALKHPYVKTCIMSDNEEDYKYSRDLGNTAFTTKEEAINFWNSTILNKSVDNCFDGPDLYDSDAGNLEA